MLGWSGFIFLASVPLALADGDLGPAQALIYESGTHRAKPIFRYKRSVSPLSGGGVRIETQFTEMSGALAFTEAAEAKGARILSYEWAHFQMGESGKVEVREGKAYYALKRKGQVERDVGDAPENLVIGPTIIAFAQNHWRELMDGAALNVRVGVPDRLNDYGFRFRREKDDLLEEAGSVRFRLSPTSLFVSLAVKPIDFIFLKTGPRLLSINGRSLLKVKRAGGWDDLVAETVFE